VLTKDSEVQTDSEDIIEMKDSEAQTDLINLKTVGVNTEEVEKETLENKLEVDENGKIHPQKNEVLIEMRKKLRAIFWKIFNLLYLENHGFPAMAAIL
jgi:hypothetical protein